MSVLITDLSGDTGDGPEHTCGDCLAVFWLHWQRDPLITNGIEYCPFCGCEFDETEFIEESSDE